MSDIINPLGIGKFGGKRKKGSNPIVKGSPKKANKTNETILDTFSLKLLGADFKIDHKSRRKSKTPYRRALVHDFNDGLTINWDKDYPGGVVINGKVKCPNKLEIAGHDILALIKNMQFKIEELEKKLEDLSWNTNG